MFPEGAAPTPNQQAPGQAPAQQQAAPPIQQQFQPPPQAQPVQQQQYAPAPMPVIPSPQNFQRPAQPAPVQQQQPAANNYDPIVNQVAAALGTSPDIVRQQLGDNLELGIASLVRDAAGVIRTRNDQQTQVQPVAQQQQLQHSSPDGKIPLADGWQSVVQKNAQGVYEAVHPQYKQYADAANHNALIDRQRFERYQQDPTLLMQAPEVQKLIQKQINDTVQAQVREQQIIALREEYRNKFGKEITQVDERGVTKMGMDGKPIMTPLGLAMMKHVNALSESGMQESRQLYETAMTLAKNEVGVQNFAANIQQQQPVLYQQQNMQGQPYYQQQAQPQTANLASMLQQNAQAYYPGQPPARGPVMQPTIEGSLYEMVKDLPDGLTAGQYLDSVGSLFKIGQR